MAATSTKRRHFRLLKCRSERPSSTAKRQLVPRALQLVWLLAQNERALRPSSRKLAHLGFKGMEKNGSEHEPRAHVNGDSRWSVREHVGVRGFDWVPAASYPSYSAVSCSRSVIRGDGGNRTRDAKALQTSAVRATPTC